jgi:hypothetical protein
MASWLDQGLPSRGWLPQLASALERPSPTSQAESGVSNRGELPPGRQVGPVAWRMSRARPADTARPSTVDSTARHSLPLSSRGSPPSTRLPLPRRRRVVKILDRESETSYGADHTDQAACQCDSDAQRRGPRWTA